MSYNSKIILCKGIKIDREYVNVLSYTEQQMLNLCNSSGIKIAEANDYTFIDRNRSIRCAFSYSDCVQANYIAFQNPDYSNKWFFAFIDNVTFKGNNNTEISFTIDAWSTWFDYWTKKSCYVLREHVNDDTIGLHTVPENLDVGEVIQEDYEQDDSYTNEYGYWIVIGSAWQPDDNSQETLPDLAEGKQYEGISVYNKQVYGNRIFLFEIREDSEFISDDISNVTKFIYRTNKDGHIEDIKDIWIVPNALIRIPALQSHLAYASVDDTVPFSFNTSQFTKEIEKFDTSITKPYNFDDITIKNNKCFCYPYNYLFVSNNNGNNNIYKYEDFNTNNCVFENQLAMGIGVSGRLVPKDYKGMLTNDDESLPLGKYPTCGWSADSYTNWLTQNGVNISSRILNTAANTIGSLFSANPVGDLSNSFNQVTSLIGEFVQAKLQPNIEGGGNTGNVLFGANKMCFTFRKMRCKNEYMTIIDNYFSRFGYQVNVVKLPNIVGRENWNYLQIGASECIGYGETPTTFMDTINKACRKGITIWHNHANVGNYSLTNSIVN